MIVSEWTLKICLLIRIMSAQTVHLNKHGTNIACVAFRNKVKVKEVLPLG